LVNSSSHHRQPGDRIASYAVGKNHWPLLRPIMSILCVWLASLFYLPFPWPVETILGFQVSLSMFFGKLNLFTIAAVPNCERFSDPSTNQSTSIRGEA